MQPRQHLAVAQEALDDAIGQETVISLETLAWLVRVAKSVYPDGRTVARVEFDMAEVEQRLIDAWKEDLTN